MKNQHAMMRMGVHTQAPGTWETEARGLAGARESSLILDLRERNEEDPGTRVSMAGLAGVFTAAHNPC